LSTQVVKKQDAAQRHSFVPQHQGSLLLRTA